MKIVVIGGTGLIGSQVVNLLKNSEHEVIAAAPDTGVNTLTGEGLDAALQNAQVVVDVSNSPSFEDQAVMDFFKTSNDNLLKAEKKAGVTHHLALSVVGTQKLQESGYFRAKQVQENMIKASGIPYTIVHATQFFEFAAGIVHMSLINDQVVLPDANIQPIASKDVAGFLAKVAIEAPKNTILEIGGPKKYPMADWIKSYSAATQKKYRIVSDVRALYSGASIETDTLAPDNAVYLGGTDYSNWIAQPENQR